jgi:hypothetical protein
MYLLHYFQVFLKERSPIPPVALQWHTYCDAHARAWELQFMDRIQQFNMLFEDKPSHNVTITLD